MMLIFWLAAGAAIYFIVTDNRAPKIQYQQVKSAEEVLRERFVNGEIDEATYQRMKATINS